MDFSDAITNLDVNSISELGLAYIGDCVFELLTRTELCLSGEKKSGTLHKKTVAFVNANAQAVSAAIITPQLTEEETVIFKRGRNTKVYSAPKNSSVANYHAATGLETLFGWLYLNGRIDRINELFALIKDRLYVN